MKRLTNYPVGPSWIDSSNGIRAGPLAFAALAQRGGEGQGLALGPAAGALARRVTERSDGTRLAAEAAFDADPHVMAVRQREIR
jgi:hypothetical protein